MSEGLTVAVLGAGEMGGCHVQAWTALGHRVAVIADLDVERAEALAERYRVDRVTADFEAAASDPGVDAVSVCLPLALHAPAVVAGARAGKHVFTEKPLSRTFAEADRMQRAVEEAGVRFGIGFQRNLAQGVTLLRDWAAQDRFGRPMVFSSDLLMEVRPKRAMHDRHGNNGPLTDGGCHYYLLWQTVFRSLPRAVYAQGRILALERPEVAHLEQLAIDTAVVTIAYESGDIGTLTVSWGLAQGFQMSRRPDRLIGPRGGAEGTVHSCLTLYEGDRVETHPIPPQDLHRVELGLFADAIAGRGRPAYGFATGRQMLAVTEAIFESIASGREVAVRWEDCRCG
jgi:predicted dehydrogenase